MPAPETSAFEPPPAAAVAPRDEAELVHSLIAGDEPAWRAFHALFAEVLLDDITRVRRQFPQLIGAADVEDIYSELCLQLLSGDKRRLRQFDPGHGTSLRAWLGVLARHAAFDFLRYRRRQPTVPFRGDETARIEILRSEELDALSVCASRERARMVATLVEGLSERDQQFVELYFYQGLDPEQTAERLGICVGTVYSKKHKIRARIESLLGRRLAA
jgi:RNA polymerase sigma-70 factor (ECF subfamily)